MPVTALAQWLTGCFKHGSKECTGVECSYIPTDEEATDRPLSRRALELQHVSRPSLALAPAGGTVHRLSRELGRSGTTCFERAASGSLDVAAGAAGARPASAFQGRAAAAWSYQKRAAVWRDAGTGASPAPFEAEELAASVPPSSASRSGVCTPVQGGCVRLPPPSVAFDAKVSQQAIMNQFVLSTSGLGRLP